eukprot:scaffold2708_cov158-Ochromonas_danica.AAC.40
MRVISRESSWGREEEKGKEVYHIRALSPVVVSNVVGRGEVHPCPSRGTESLRAVHSDEAWHALTGACDCGSTDSVAAAGVGADLLDKRPVASQTREKKNSEQQSPPRHPKIR